MKHLVALVAVLLLGIGTASAGHHNAQPPGPERGQGLSGQGAKSSGGKSTEAILKNNGKGKQNPSNHGQSNRVIEGGDIQKGKKGKNPKNDDQ